MPPTLAAHAIRAAVERAGIDGAEVDDALLGSALPQGGQRMIGRTAALRAGLPVAVAGMTMDRQCASGLMAIATAAKQIIVDDGARRLRPRSWRTAMAFLARGRALMACAPGSARPPARQRVLARMIPYPDLLVTEDSRVSRRGRSRA
ncbi:hypothetical protein GCM10009087_50110 [Sphingomonas oligophenolica]